AGPAVAGDLERAPHRRAIRLRPEADEVRVAVRFEVGDAQGLAGAVVDRSDPTVEREHLHAVLRALKHPDHDGVLGQRNADALQPFSNIRSISWDADLAHRHLQTTYPGITRHVFQRISSGRLKFPRTIHSRDLPNSRRGRREDG